jgi:hypothetical protein
VVVRCARSVASGVPGGAGRDVLSAACAAAESPASYWDGEGFGQEIDVDVGGSAAVGAGCGDHATPLARMLARVIGGPGGAGMG